jgi:putative ATPase
LASSPKSNSSYKAINKAIQTIKDGGKFSNLEVPNHIKDKPIDYINPHEFGGYVEQDYLSLDIKLYESNLIGFEKTLNEWQNKIKNS